MDDYNSTTSPSHPFGWKEKEHASEHEANVRRAAQQREHEGKKQEENFPDWDGSEAQYV